VAWDLLGKVLVSRSVDGTVAVRLTEVEAYLGPDDPACHTAGRKRTDRVQSMWGEAGRAYVYMIYGLHHCLNVVTVGEAGEAILLRGAVAVSGDELIRLRRGPTVSRKHLLNGPGKLCQALAVDRGDDGVDLCDSVGRLWIADDGTIPRPEAVEVSGRIGVDYAGDAAHWPLRFVWRPDGHAGIMGPGG